MMMRALLAMLAPGGARSPLSVLIFHRVRPTRDLLFPGDPDASEFGRQMQWIRDWFNVLPMEDAVAGLRSGRLPARALVITFDDGYADNLTVATPILKRLGLPATFFVATGFVDGGIMWNDSVIEAIRRYEQPSLELDAIGLGTYATGNFDEKRSAISSLLGRLKYLPHPERMERVSALVTQLNVLLPRGLMLTSAQLGELAEEGMTIGAHTISHPILTQISPAEARREVAESREWLQSVVKDSVRFFAYPNGKPGRDYDETHVRIVREMGFAAAFSTSAGIASADCDLFQIPRFTPWDRSALLFGLRLARNLTRQAQLCF